MDFDGEQRIVADSKGLSWITADCHELQRIDNGELECECNLQHIALRIVMSVCPPLIYLTAAMQMHHRCKSGLCDLIMNHSTISLRFFNIYTLFLVKFVSTDRTDNTATRARASRRRCRR
jgi:hypothetical protein